MKRFKKILWVADKQPRSRTSFDRAVTLAQESNALLAAIKVVRKTPRAFDMKGIGITGLEIDDFMVEAAREELEKMIAPFQKDRMRVQAKALVGIPFIEIIREVLRGKFDLVMKESEGRGGITARLFGSLDRNLLRNCPCPVWISKPTRRRRYGKILAAVDPLDPEYSDPQQNFSINSRILELASSLCARERSQLHVVHSWYWYKEFTTRGHYSMTEYKMANLLREARNIHSKALAELLQGCSLELPKNTVHLIKGEPEVSIPALAKRLKSDLIVMGTVGRTGIPGFFIGNTAEEILQRVDCSVLAIKPDSFETPVELNN